MTQAGTLAELITNNRAVDRTVSYLETESSERVVSYGELHERAEAAEVVNRTLDEGDAVTQFELLTAAAFVARRHPGASPD